MRRHVLPLILVAAAGGCTGASDDYPSLLPRAVESRADSTAPAPAPTPTPDAALDTSVARLSDKVAAAKIRFSATAGDTEQAVRASGAATVGSDAWLTAQNALADLDSMRADMLSPLADLERLAIDRADAGKPPYPPLETALETAEQADAEQADRLDALEAMAGG